MRLETGVKVVEVDVDHSAISLDDGRKVTADLVVAADGVHVSSSLRFEGERSIPAALECVRLDDSLPRRCSVLC